MSQEVSATGAVKTAPKERRITIMNIIGYAYVNFLGDGSTVLISAWLMFFYTTMCGLSAISASVIFQAVHDWGMLCVSH